MPRRKTPRYTYKGQQFDSEGAMLLHLLDDYRCIEGFAARYLGAWQAVAQHASIAGGLRTVCGREQLHADLLAARLRELGGTPQCDVPPERLADLDYYSTAEHSDAAKLGKIAARLQDPDKVLQFLTEAIAQIDADRETRELLCTILDDERATIAWFRNTWQALQSETAAAVR
jgi:bacterioferritin (cytochrome b1)